MPQSHYTHVLNVIIYKVVACVELYFGCNLRLLFVLGTCEAQGLVLLFFSEYSRYIVVFLSFLFMWNFSTECGSTRLRYVAIYSSRETYKHTLYSRLICHLVRTAPSEMGCNFTAFRFTMIGNCGGFNFLVRGQMRYVLGELKTRTAHARVHVRT